MVFSANYVKTCHSDYDINHRAWRRLTNCWSRVVDTVRQPQRSSMDLSSAFSPFHAAQAERSPEFPVADTRPSVMHSSVTPYVPHPISLNSYFPPEYQMYQWTGQREAFLNHKFLAYYPGFGHGLPYSSNEDEKPSQSYIGLIGKAILSSPQKKLVLSDIYNFILTHHSYFRNKGPGWRNSIRHNLSLNECFIKVGRSPNGKGHYWAINPANYEDFSKGEYRRKRAQRRNRKSADSAKKEPKQEERSRPLKPEVKEPAKQKETANRGFHIDTLLADTTHKPTKRSAFTFVVPSLSPLHSHQLSPRQLPVKCIRGEESLTL